MFSDNSRILVIRFSSLGDLVLMLPMLRALRMEHPTSVIEVVTKARFGDLFKSVAGVDRLHLLKEEDITGLSRMVSLLRRHKYDLLIDAHNVIRSRALSLMLRADRKIRLRKEHMKKILLIKGRRPIAEGFTSQIDRYLEITDSIGVPRPNSRTLLETSEETRLTVSEKLDINGRGDRDLVAIAPGARWASKRWPEESFNQVANNLAGRGFCVLLVGNGEERELCERIRNNNPHIINLAGNLKIHETAAALEISRCLVTNDSAPMHLAEAVDTPVVAIFGPTIREFGFSPHLPHSILVDNAMECRPCSRNGSVSCRFGTLECLTSIDSERVLESVAKILDDLPGNIPGGE
ncbi:MAG: lipopolysaccharide heptosyltransferase II [Candidatus Krumholzibacteria bacterium]|nr:lipopolysaccharide heptosyltransferase II [Candidatus Krumholzibacteria bacterium]